MPETIKLNRNTAAKKIQNLSSGEKHSLTFKKKLKVDVIEMEDLNFHFDSAVMLPDYGSKAPQPGTEEQNRITGLSVLYACYKHAEKNNFQQLLLIAGHTDKKGGEFYNLTLSQKRAENVFLMFSGNRSGWVNSSNDKHQTEDVQQILKWISYVFKWDCDPGEKTNKSNPETEKALLNFQKTYNSEFVKQELYKEKFLRTFSKIDEDGKLGKQTWGAFYDMYILELLNQMFITEPELTTLRAKLNYVKKTPNHPAPIVGCGENFPASGSTSENENAVDRRVEILFFDSGEEPLLKCHPGKFNCIKSKCDLYNSETYKLIPVPSNVKPPKPSTFWPVNIKGKLFWNRTWDYNDETKPIAAIQEYLPGAKAELYIETKRVKTSTLQESLFLSDKGEFQFKSVPECTKATLRILLEHRDGKIVVVKGKSNAVSQVDFEIKTGKVIWHQFNLDMSKLDGKTKDVDFADIEIKKAHFIDICDAYKSVWFGHERIKKLGDHDLPVCQINYPEPPTSTSNASVQMQLLKDDLKDRDVILHEYGHFIGHNILGGLSHPGYGYNDDATGQHGRDTKEHYESAWNEGHATFLSCAITDDPHYHDGYDTTLDYHLDKDNTTIGPHSEGSIQEALWRIYKVHGTDFKDGFWKAFTDRSKRTVRTIFEFYDNWKDLGLKDLDKVVEAFKKFNMEFGYRYLDGTERYTAVALPKKFDKGKKEFQKIDELHDNFGKLGGGTSSDYNEEFYNRNKHFNAGALGAGSTISNPKTDVGKKYITPDRIQVK